MKNYDNLKLDHQLCFALYAATNAITRSYREGLDKAGLTYPQYLVMLVLWEDKKSNVGAIAKRLYLDSATLTPMLKRIESSGFIKRKRNSLDERVVEIELTEKGADLQQDIATIQQSVQCQTGLCHEDFMHLKNTLHILVNTMTHTESMKTAA